MAPWRNQEHRRRIRRGLSEYLSALALALAAADRSVRRFRVRPATGAGTGGVFAPTEPTSNHSHEDHVRAAMGVHLWSDHPETLKECLRFQVEAANANRGDQAPAPRLGVMT